jgi:hypothetical protein
MRERRRQRAGVSDKPVERRRAARTEHQPMETTPGYEDEAAGAADELLHEQGRRFLKRELPHLSDAEINELLDDLLRV